MLAISSDASDSISSEVAENGVSLEVNKVTPPPSPSREVSSSDTVAKLSPLTFIFMVLNVFDYWTDPENALILNQ